MPNAENKRTSDNKGKRLYIRTFGCQMNERDSELIAGMLVEKGYEIAKDREDADIFLFNTCSVRQHAEDRVIGNLQKLASQKRKNPDIRIGVLGCMAQRHGEMLFKEYPQVDMVVGPSNIFDIPDLMNKIFDSEKLLAVDRKSRPRKKAGKDHHSGVFSAYVNIMYGCDNFCSYCIVPYVRGREVSRPKKDIIDEVKALADAGFKEVTLLGQNVNSYGKGLTNKISFPDLLEEVNRVKGIERVRFTTSHPKDASKGLFRAMQEMDKVCEHIHLPIQSGSDKILDLMNRKYKLEDYMKKVELLRKMIPDVGLSSDIIVGFPSERDKDHKATMKAMEEKNADLEVVAPIARKAEGTDEIRCYQVPGGKMARIVHKGPYDACNPTYDKLFAWIGENGMKICGPIREMYLNDPREVGMEEALTEIHAPVE